MDTSKIKQIIELFEESKISAMDLEIDDIKIKLEKQLTPVQVQTIQPAIAEAMPVEQFVIKDDKNDIKSPLVGTFYVASNAGAKPFVEVGSTVHEGDVLCVIEAMKVMNEIKVHCDGVIKEIYVKDGEMVQFDQAIMAIGD